MKLERCEEERLNHHVGIQNHNTSFRVTDLKESTQYDFEIVNHQKAILHTDGNECPQEVIEEFLFYSGFINHIETLEGTIIYHQPKKKVMKVPLLNIQPSQLYINEAKLNRLLTWIQKPEDIIIPIIEEGNQWISIDGHTRLKAAELLGFSEIYVYLDEYEPYIDDFVYFCQKEQKFNIRDLPIITNEAYQIKWCLFCESYFKSKEV